MSGTPCAPAYLAGAPSSRKWCVCGEPVKYVRVAEGVNDWAVEDTLGRRSVWTGPPEWEGDAYGYLDHVRSLFYDGKKCLDGPQADWAAREYSSLSCALALGAGGVFWHYHRVDFSRSEGLSGDAWKCPECCGSPMWASPDGWSCRVRKTLVPYAEES